MAKYKKRSFLRIVPLSEAGSALREIRKLSKGLTIEDMAERTEMIAATISSIENDKSNINRSQIEKIAKALNLGEPHIIFFIDDDDLKRFVETGQ